MLVGVDVGNSVAVGLAESVAITDSAIAVNWTNAVAAAEVCTAAISWVGVAFANGNEPHADNPIIRIKANEISLNWFLCFMLPPYGQTNE
jgi:hypothetical protein